MADAISSPGAGMVSVPLGFLSATGSNTAPFWNNNSLDGPNLNAGNFLTGGNRVMGTTDYIGSGNGLGRYLSMSSEGLDQAPSFTFLQGGGSAQVTLLYTNAAANADPFGTEIGLYNANDESDKLVLFAHGTLYNWGAAFGIFNNNQSPQSPFAVNTWANYGVYARTCGINPDQSRYCDTYYSNSGLNQSSESIRQHFALFQNAQNPGTYFIGFEDLRGITPTEGFGDFNDAIIRIQTTGINITEVVPTPEPATFWVLGTGLVGLGLLRRGRFSKQRA